MAEETTRTEEVQEPGPAVHVAPGPHLSDRSLTTRKMMIDVLIGLSAVLAVAAWMFRGYLLTQLGICVLSCLAAEAIFTAMRRRAGVVLAAAAVVMVLLYLRLYPAALLVLGVGALLAAWTNARAGRGTLGDCSAAVTGVILALSLPGVAPWHVGVVGSFVAIGIGKVVFGGLGQNIFNPAMVGRAFVMIAFPALLAAGGYVVGSEQAWVDTVTAATPLTAGMKAGKGYDLWELMKGTTNGSLGERGAIACLVGGLYLCIRRTACWEIPFAMLAAVAVIGGIANLTDLSAEWTVLHHLTGGAVMFGAFFVATDPVTSPLTRKGKLIFGAGIGTLVMIMRLFSSWPEGVMFSVLLMNAVVPLINRWTVPRPLGGPVPEAT